MSQGEEDESLGRRVLVAKIEGQTYRQIARELGMTQARVRELHVEEANRVLSAEEMLLDRAESVTRMRELEAEFFKLGKAGDAACAMVSIKAQERRMTTLGGNAPIAYGVKLVTAAAPAEETSTEFYRRTLDRLMGPPEDAAEGDTKPN